MKFCLWTQKSWLVLTLVWWDKMVNPNKTGKEKISKCFGGVYCRGLLKKLMKKLQPNFVFLLLFFKVGLYWRSAAQISPLAPVPPISPHKRCISRKRGLEDGKKGLNCKYICQFYETKCLEMSSKSRFSSIQHCFDGPTDSLVSKHWAPKRPDQELEIVAKVTSAQYPSNVQGLAEMGEPNFRE